MSREVRHVIAGILALVMVFGMIEHAGGMEARLAAALELNTGSEEIDLQELLAQGYSLAPEAELVGIYTIEWEDVDADFADEEETVEDTEKDTEENTEETEEETTEKSTEESTEANTEKRTEAAPSTEAEEPTEEVTEEPTTAPEEEKVPSAYEGVAVISLLTDYVNVRSDASVEASIVGRMYPGTKGTILEERNGWYHIQSGSVDGWISAQYTVTGRAADEFVKANMKASITIATDVLRVRAAADVNSAYLDYAKRGEIYAILGEENGWYKIECEPGVYGYVYGNYVTVGANHGSAMNNDEVAAYEYQKYLETKAASIGAQLRSATYATEEQVILLAALCRHETGVDDYYSSLAVANVVINRIRNGYWGTTIESVIYAPGQFQYVEEGILDRYIDNPGANCIQAARDALAGINNIGNYIFFRSEKTAEYDEYSSWINVGGNVFYQKK